jgi:HlyD family secretion protein
MSEYSLLFSFKEGILMFSHSLRIITLLSLLLVTACSPDSDWAMSGTIEADELPIAAETGGKVITLLADEGAPVKQGQIIAKIDDSTLRLQVEEAKASLEQATAKLEEAKAGTRDQSLRQGAAQVQQAEANVAQTEARFRQAKANYQRAAEQLQQANAQLEGAKRTLAYQQARQDEIARLFQNGAATKRDYEAQQEAVSQARTQVEQLTAQVSAARSQTDSAKSEMDAAQAQIGMARSQATDAAARLDLLQEGSTSYTLKALLAAQTQARARLGIAELQAEQANITAPHDGVILRKNISQGEVVKPGSTLFTMMKTDSLKLKVYIPEAELGLVKAGQPVEVQVDAYPGERFAGTVSFISDKAEFTPKHIETRDERTKMVFAVTITLKDGLDRLKPGMPADVFLSEGGREK